MRKKILLIILPVILVLYFILAIYGYPGFISDKKKNQDSIIKQLELITGRKVSAAPEISFKLFPYPSYKVNNLTISEYPDFVSADFFRSSSVNVQPSFLSLLSFGFIIGKAEVVEPEIFFEIINGGITNLVNKSKDPPNISITGMKFVFNGGKVVFTNPSGEDFMQREMFPGILILKISSSGNISVNGDIVIPDSTQPVNVNASIGSLDEQKKNYPVELNIGYSGTSMKVVGELANLQANPEMKGRFEFHAPDIFSGAVTNYFIKNYFTTEALIGHKIDASGDISLSYNKIEGNILFDSPGFKATGKISGSVADNVVVSFDSESLNVSELIKWSPAPVLDNNANQIYTDEAQDSEPQQEGVQAINSVVQKYITPLPEGFPIRLNMNIKQVVFGDIKPENFSISFLFNGNYFGIDNYKFSLQGMEFSGGLEFAEYNTNAGVGSKIQGDIKITGNDIKILPGFSEIKFLEMKDSEPIKFVLASRFSMLPDKIYLEDIDSFIDDANIKGSILIDPKTGNVREYKFKLDKLNFDKYREKINAQEFIDFAIKPPPSDVITLTIFDKIRMVDYKTRLELEVGELIYNGEKIKNAKSFISLEPAFLEFSEIGGDGEHFKINSGYIRLRTNALRPFFEANFDFDKIDLTGVFEDPEKTEQERQKSIWSKKQISFAGAEEFDADVNFKIKDLIFNRVVFSNVLTHGTLDDRVISVDKFVGDFLGGKIDMRANLSTAGRLAAGLSFAVSNGDIESSLKQVIGKGDVSGKFSISGSAQVEGYDLASWAEKMDGSINLVVVSPQFNNFDLKLLINKLPKIKAPGDFDAMMNKVLSQGKTRFGDFAANFFINDGIIRMSGNNLKNDEVISNGIFSFAFDVNTLDIASKTSMNVLTKDSYELPIVIEMKKSPVGFDIEIDTSSIRNYWEERELSKLKNTIR